MIGPAGFQQAPKPETRLESSSAFKAGQAAKRRGDNLAKSGLRNLRFGSQQYDDFVAGYDSVAVA